MKSKRLPIVFLIISICLIVLGYFLWTILFPVQDVNLMSAEEFVLIAAYLLKYICEVSFQILN